MKKKRERQHMGGGFFNFPDSVAIHTIEKKIERFNIIPYIVSDPNHEYMSVGEPWYEKTYFVHYNIGPNETSIVCPNKTAGKPCPVCDKLRQMQRDPDADEDELKSLIAKERQLFIIQKPGDDKIEILSMSYHNFGRQLEEELDDGEEEYGDFAEAEGGLVLKVRWGEEQIGKTKFKRAGRIDFSEREEELSEETLKNAICLDEALVIKSENEILKLLADGGNDEIPDSDKGGTSKRNTKRKDEDEDEDEDFEDEEEDFEEEEDEDPAPKKKKAPAKKKVEPEPEEDEDDEDFEDEEEDEEDEEDEDPPPKKKAPAKKAPAKKAPAKKKSEPEPDEEDDDDIDDEGEDEGWDEDDEDW